MKPSDAQRVEAIRVGVGPRDGVAYDVSVGASLVASLGGIVRGAVGEKAKRACVIADKNLPSEVMSRIDISLSRAGFFVARVGIEATEEKKSLATLESVLAFIASTKLERHEPVIAIGGGVVGDLAGFAASVHRRGCPVVQVPTTLLAMVDASVGGKTGVNLSIHSSSGPAGTGGGGKTLLKNAAGAFHQPRAVVASLDMLDSLPRRQFASGLAECVKHALIGGECGEAGLLDWMEKEAKQRGSETARQGWNSEALRELVARNVAIKARVVAGDELEVKAERGRALLNLGHTFGHAIETLPGLSFTTVDGEVSGTLLHGEAVAIGLVAACRVGVALTMCDAALVERVRALLVSCGLPVAVKGLPGAEAVLARMAHDKKVAGGVMRLVVPTDGMRAKVVEGVEKSVVVGAIEGMG